MNSDLPVLFSAKPRSRANVGWSSVLLTDLLPGWRRYKNSALIKSIQETRVFRLVPFVWCHLLSAAFVCATLSPAGRTKIVLVWPFLVGLYTSVQINVNLHAHYNENQRHQMAFSSVIFMVSPHTWLPLALHRCPCCWDFPKMCQCVVGLYSAAS